ncbi:MAG: adenylate/guanylate cyclase domain-containing protein [Cyanobacteria bacterium P01_H01_bin.119]
MTPLQFFTLVRQGWRWVFTNPPLISGLFASAIGIGLLVLHGWEPLERLAYNRLFQARDYLTPLAWDQRIVVIAIDQASLDQYGRFPWPRDRYAALLDKLLTVQPAAVGFDILFVESTVHDVRLAESLAISGNGVLAIGGDGTGRALPLSPDLQRAGDSRFLLGHVKHVPDIDGISRQVWLYEGQFPTLGMAMVQMYNITLSQTLGNNVPDPVDIPESLDLETENPSDRAYFSADPLSQVRETRWINWPDSIQNGSLTILSFADVMSDRVDIAHLQNKIVLVGTTAAALDPLRTPFYTTIPIAGVYLHAAVLDNLLQNRFLQRWSLGKTALLLMLVGFTTSFTLSPLSLKHRLLLLSGLILLWLGIVYSAFTQQLWLPVAAPIGTCLSSALGLQFKEQRERETVMSLLALNTSPEMANLMWKNKTDILSKGQIRPQELMATVLFTDIRGFTGISETLSSEALLPWLNRYFEVMTDCIMAHGGIVDKYIGDAIMAVFGAPIPHTRTEEIQQDAIAAISASLAMCQALEPLNQEFASVELPPIRFGVGIHTGIVIGGTVGSRQHISYSLFGDTVNVAARLQDLTKGLTKEAPYPVLMSEQTYSYAKAYYQGKSMGTIRLRGRATQTPVFTPVALGDKRPPNSGLKPL